MSAVPAPPEPAAPSLRGPATALMVASGFAGLAYQIVWTQQLGVWLGHDLIAALAVVAAFFGGLALGAWALGDHAARHPRPGLLYAQLELAIALWALLLIALMPVAGAALTRAIGTDPTPLRQWLVTFGGPLLLLLPATAAMGATLPALQALAGRWSADGYAIGALYAANTFGALAGVLGAAFLLAPALGFSGTAALAVLANLGCALIAWRRFGQVRVAAGSGPIRPAAAARPQAPLAVLALTGLLGIGHEVLVVRVASQLAENTVYTYALLLAVYLAGTASGAALWQRWRDRVAAADTAAMRGHLLLATSLAVLASGLALASGDGLKPALLAMTGPSYAAALGAEALLGLFAFLPPTIAMGALFSQLAAEARDQGWPLGRALAANTVGAMLAAPLVGVALLPAFGPTITVALLAAGYLLPLALPRSKIAWRGLAAGSAALAAWLLVQPPLTHVDLPPQGRIVSHRDGVQAAVTVVADADGTRYLHINNRAQEGSSATVAGDGRLAWLPLLLHAAPKRALFLGLGTGATSAAAAADPELDTTVVELLPEVIDARRHFLDDDAAAAPTIITADARRLVRASTARWDVIVADLFHPARSGSAALFTVEHFAAVRERLGDDGLFCQWLPLHQLDADSLRAIVSAFLRVYPDARALLASGSLDTPVIGLVGQRDARPFDPARLAERHAEVAGRVALDRYAIEDRWVAPGAVVADAAALRAYAGTATPNRDDRPLVAWRAPRLTYAPESTPRQRLAALLGDWQAAPDAVFGPPASDSERAVQARVARYWQARDAFIRAGLRVQPAASPERLLGQIAAPLLDVLETSADFRPAYDPLLRIAVAAAPAAPDAAHAVLSAMARLQPARPEAVALLARFAPVSTPAPLSP